jgi:cytochrome P450 family 6
MLPFNHASAILISSGSTSSYKSCIAAILPHLTGAEWRNIRVRMTPTFTSGKMKLMFKTVLDTAHLLDKFLDKRAERSEVIEVKEVMARFTTDVIGSCAFGIDVNSLDNPDSEFFKMGKASVEHSTLEMICMMLGVFFPEISETFKVL